MRTLSADDQAQTGMAKMAVGLVVTLLVVGLIGATMLPIGINAITGDTTETITQDTSETVEVNAVLNSTLDSTNAGTNATYTLNVSDGAEKTKTIAVGTNKTFSFDRGGVTVNVSESNSGNATADFSAPKQFAYGDGARAMWGILDVIIVLGMFLFVISIALVGLRDLS